MSTLDANVYHLRRGYRRRSGRQVLNKLHEWGAKPVYLPRSLVVLIFLFVMVLTIEAFARHQASKLAPPIKWCVPCSCDSNPPTYL